jgi:hypothetical protein
MIRSLHQLAAIIRSKSESKPEEHPEAPHFIYNERDHWDGADSMADWAIDQQPKEL